MSTVHAISARLSAVLFVLLFCSTAFAGSAKVEICHIPPDNPENFHTIKINKNDLDVHLAHFDLVGACNDLCAELCDDGNACTIDDLGDCQQNGCPVESAPVDCSDSNLCTDDNCNPDSGCFNPVAVTCETDDLCISKTCDPHDGVCEETRVVCDEGETCNPDNGACEQVIVCPCFSLSDLQAGGTIAECGENFPGFEDLAGIIYDTGDRACSGVLCADDGPVPSCALFQGSESVTVSGLTEAEDADCRTLILDICKTPNATDPLQAETARSSSVSLFIDK